jgi:beta-xylosidase
MSFFRLTVRKNDIHMTYAPTSWRLISPLYALASRGGPIEAPSIVHRQGYYYLFVSFDLCCLDNGVYRLVNHYKEYTYV